MAELTRTQVIIAGDFNAEPAAWLKLRSKTPHAYDTELKGLEELARLRTVGTSRAHVSGGEHAHR